MEGKLTIEGREGDYLVTVKEYEEGSSTSFGAESYEDAYESALIWLGIDIYTLHDTP